MEKTQKAGPHGRTNEPERRDRKIEDLQRKMAAAEVAISRGNYAFFDGESAVIRHGGERSQVLYNDRQFTEGERTDFVNAWFAEQKEQLVNAHGFDVTPPPFEAALDAKASLEEIWDYNERLLRQQNEFQQKVIELDFNTPESPASETWDMEDLIDQHEVAIAQCAARQDRNLELWAKLERAKEMDPEEVGAHNTEVRRDMAAFEESLDNIQRRIEFMKEQRPNDLAELYQLLKLEANLDTEIEILNRRILPERRPERLMPFAKEISHKTFNEAANNSMINGEGAANYALRLQNAAELVHLSRVEPAVQALIRKNPKLLDNIMAEEVGIRVEPVDYDSEVLGAALVGAIDDRYGTPREVPEFTPKQIDVRVVPTEAEPISEEAAPEPVTAKEAEAGVETRKTEEDKMVDAGFFILGAAVIAGMVKDWWTGKPKEGDVSELSEADYQIMSEEEAGLPELTEADYEEIPAVEGAALEPEAMGPEAAAVVAQVYADQLQAPKGIWERVKGGTREAAKKALRVAAPAFPYLPWIQERMRGSFTMGITTLLKAKDFRVVTNELGLKIKDLNLDAWDLNPEWQEHLKHNVNLPPAAILAEFEAQKEENERKIEEIVALAKKELEEKLGRYTKKNWTRIFGETTTYKQYTADVVAQEIVTQKKLAAFGRELREMLEREHRAEYLATAEDYTALMRKHIDPEWWKRYFYAGLEATFAIGTGYGLAGLVQKGFETIGGLGAEKAVQHAGWNLESLLNFNQEAAAAEAAKRASEAGIGEVANRGAEFSPLSDAGREGFSPIVHGGGVTNIGNEAALNAAGASFDAAREVTYQVSSNGLESAARQMAQTSGLNPDAVGLKTIQQMQIAGAKEWGVGIQSTFENHGLWGATTTPTPERVGEEVFSRLVFPNAEKAGAVMWDTSMTAQDIPPRVVDRMVQVLAERAAAGTASI